MLNILFLCIHNSARSQMAEAFINNKNNPDLNAESAGLEAGRLNPIVVKVMMEVGIDISCNKTKNVSEKTENNYDYVITVCDDASAERCPVFPGKTKRLHWSIPDPSALKGTEEEILKEVRNIREQIKNKIDEFLSGIIESL